MGPLQMLTVHRQPQELPELHLMLGLQSEIPKRYFREDTLRLTRLSLPSVDLLGLVDISFKPYESSGEVQESHEASS